MSMPGAYRSQNGALDLLGLELEKVVSHHNMDAGNQSILGLVEEEQVLLNTEPSFQGHAYHSGKDPAIQEIEEVLEATRKRQARCTFVTTSADCSARPHGLESAVGWRCATTTDSMPWLCWPTGARSLGCTSQGHMAKCPPQLVFPPSETKKGKWAC